MTSSMASTFSVTARPYDFTFSKAHTALLVIDMQRDFLLPGGFGSFQGVDMTDVQAAVSGVQSLLRLFRQSDMTVIHTREGHKADLSDCPSSKLHRNVPCRSSNALKIGDTGEMGRLLIRGEHGHDFVDEVAALPGELIIDKPGKGAFWSTPLMDELRARAITHLVVCGVTTECCLTTTIREANDRGFECCAVTEATAGYVPDFKDVSLRMLDFAGGLFGFTASLRAFEASMTKSIASGQVNGHAANGHINGVTNGHVGGDEEECVDSWSGDVSISGLTSYYKSGGSLSNVLNTLYDRIEQYDEVDSAIWIHRVSRADILKAATALAERYPESSTRPPLYGVPFTVKDSLDVTEITTTVACTAMSYMAESTALVCQRALDAGGIFLGKVNLDCFATGLSGCRSPFGTPHSVFSPSFISGGSSSGSAVSVGAKLCSFSIATDTAGSGRVPAGFNSVVGFKPTRGTLSTVGLIPAIPSLDCIALIASNVEDTRAVWNVVKGFDERDPYAKWAVSRPRPVHSLGPQATSFRFGIPPPEAMSVVCPKYKQEFAKACALLTSIGGVREDSIDWSPFLKAGNLLYDGTFVSERLATLPPNWLSRNAESLHPVVRELLEAVEARQSTAVDAYRDLIAKAQHTRHAETVFRAGEGGIDVLVVPTAPIHWTIEEMQEEPIARNALLGTFTHFGNVLDLCAVAVPASTYDAAELGERCPAVAKGERLPFGVTLLGMSGTDAETLEIARRFAVAGQ